MNRDQLISSMRSAIASVTAAKRKSNPKMTKKELVNAIQNEATEASRRIYVNQSIRLEFDDFKQIAIDGFNEGWKAAFEGWDFLVHVD